MMDFIFDSLQHTVALLFIVVIVCTVIISYVFADRLQKHHNGDFTWSKALPIIGIEVALLFAFLSFVEFFQAYWEWITIGTIIVLYIIMRRKKRRY